MQRGTLNTHFRVVKGILCESLGRRGRRLHTESTTYSQQVTRRGNGPYGCSVCAWVIRSIGQVILHQEKKSSEFQAMVMGSVTFFGVTCVI